MHKLAEFRYSRRADEKKLDILFSGMFSTCDINTTAMLSTFVNVEFKTLIIHLGFYK